MTVILIVVLCATVYIYTVTEEQQKLPFTMNMTRLYDQGVMNLMRKDGYRKALADAGISFAEDHVIENVRSIHESYRVVTQLLKSGAGRIGLCMNMDHLALAAISAAHDCGARIPEDIGLVGYDDIDSAKYMTPALTTISQSKYAIGAQSAIQVINARDGAEPWRKVLKPTLVVRRST